MIDYSNNYAKKITIFVNNEKQCEPIIFIDVEYQISNLTDTIIIKDGNYIAVFKEYATMSIELYEDNKEFTKHKPLVECKTTC